MWRPFKTNICILMQYTVEKSVSSLQILSCLLKLRYNFKKGKNKLKEKKLSNLWFHKVDSFSLHNVFMGVNHTIKEQLWYESYNGNLTVSHFLWPPALQRIQKKCIPAWTTPALPAMPLIQKLIMINSELVISQSCFWRYLSVFS